VALGVSRAGGTGVEKTPALGLPVARSALLVGDTGTDAEGRLVQATATSAIANGRNRDTT